MAPREVPFEPSDSTGPSRYTFWVMIFMFFLSGAAALMYQIIWAKQFARIFGVTLYATSAVVTTFMAGLALGNAIAARHADRKGRWFSLLFSRGASVPLRWYFLRFSWR